MVGKNWIQGGLGPLVVNIIVYYCCTRVCYTLKQLEETETEETLGFFAKFLSLVALSLLAPVVHDSICYHVPPKIATVGTLVHNEKSVVRSASRGYQEVFHLFIRKIKIYV